MSDKEQRIRERAYYLWLGEGSPGGHAARHWSEARQIEEHPDFNFTPELHLKDRRIIRNIEDAIMFMREHEARPGVDRRDEVLHALERAQTKEAAYAAAHLFVEWLEELGVLA
jgi:hypothetical protein